MNSRMVDKVYYVYRHIRLDKNEVFYVGIGTSYKIYTESYEVFYKRAFQTNQRSKFWERVFNKIKIRIEIVFESYDKDKVKQKEIEFISLYGRRDLGKGTLVNLTNGGEGSEGMIHSEESRQKIRDHLKKYGHPLKGVKMSEETKRKISDANRGKCVGEKSVHYGIPKTEEQKRKMSEAKKKYLSLIGAENHNFGKNYSGANNHNSKKVLNTKTGVEYVSLKEAAEAENINYGTLNAYLKGRRKNKTNLIVISEFNEKSGTCIVGKKRPFNKVFTASDHPFSKLVVNIETGIKYDCIKEASIAEGINYSTLRSYLQGRSKNKTNLRLVNEQ